MADIHNCLLKEGIESVICYGRGKSIDEPYVHKTSSEFLAKVNSLKSRFTGIPYGGCFFSTLTLIKIIEKEKPDIVHLHCINGYFVNIYKLLNYLKRKKVPTVLTLHAEFMHTGNCSQAYECEQWKTSNGCVACKKGKKVNKSVFFDKTYKNWTLMKKAFDGFDRLVVVSVSEWLKSRAEASAILMDKINKTVLNGVDTSVFCLKHDINKTLKKYGIDNDRKFVFFPTASFSLNGNSRKGGKFLVKLANMMDDTTFVVAASNSNFDYLPRNVRFLGRISEQSELADFYNAASVTLILSKAETFAMSVAESLCCGTPVVGFKAGGPESVTIEEYSEFVNYPDVNTLKDIVAKFLNTDFDSEKMSQAAKNKYSENRMTSDYLRIYKEVFYGNKR